MSGITSGVGVFSGINSQQIIDQLLAIDSRPKALFQKRVTQIQSLQAAYLDVNSKISALKSAAQAFSTNSLFRAATATSNNNDALTATASTGAAPGVYNFVVDRLVSTQQSLSAGFANSNADGVGLTKFTVESAQARLDRDTDLSQLNGGQGISRGKLVVTDSSGGQATIDLSRAGTVNDVLNAFKSATGVKLNASISGDGFVIQDTAGGGGTLTIANATDSTTATSLGIVGTAVAGKITGARVNTIGGQTALAGLNGGLGVAINTAISTSPTPDFRIATLGGNTYDIDIGDIYTTGTGGAVVKSKSAVTDLAGVIQRINEQTAGAVTASIDPVTNGLKLVDNSAPDSGGSFAVTELNGGTTAKDLGLLSSTSGNTIAGRRLTATLNSTLARNLRGGAGINGTGAFNVTTADGTNVAFTLDNSQSISDIISGFNTAAAGKATLAISKNGTGFTLTDNTTGGTTRAITGDGALTLGLDASDFSTGAAKSARSQLQYIGSGTRLATLNGGSGVGTGTIELINSYGERTTVAIDNSVLTIGDLNKKLTGSSLQARVNDNGDGIVVEEVARAGGPGGQAISIKDISGGVARNLNLVGTATGTGSANKVNGSFERTVTLSATDTLDTVNTKINELGSLVTASVLNDGSGTRPYRLSLTARQTGIAGAFVVDTEGTDLGLQNVAEARNARVFYGSSDPARGVLLTSTTNTISGAIDKVSIDLKAESASPITITVSRDTAALQKGVTDFIDAFNAVISSVDTRSTYDSESKKKGVLLGDSTSQSLRSDLFSTVSSPPQGVTGRYRTLAEIGVTISSGKLVLDSNKLTNAIATDANAVASLISAKTAAATTTDSNGRVPVRDANGNVIPGAFTNPVSSGQFTSLGVLEKVGNLADRYIRAVDGVLTRRTKTLDDQIKDNNARITSVDASISRRRDVLTRQFAAMEEAIGKLQGQSSSLSSIRAI